ncbi:MAG: formyl transferase [Actinomycetota bacterium]|nr:formyl transferase [Actinomycetota bacterium]
MTQDDPFYVIRFFDVFFAEYPRDEFEIVGVTVARAFRESRGAVAKRMLRFYGAGDFVRVLARFARAKARGRSIAGLAESAGVPLIPTVSVNDPEYVRRVGAAQPEVIVSVAAPEIFREELLTVPRLGCLNIHSGRLPKYRGMMPTFWQMLAGEPHATVTIHEMVPQLDAGRVLATLEYPLRDNDSLDRVMSETKREGARLMIEVLRQIRAGEASPKQLDMGDASYFSFPPREKVAEFRRRGHSLI